MADDLRVEIITRDFNRMLEEMADIDPKIEFRDIVIGVAARVAFNAMNRTKAAKVSSIRGAFAEREYTTFNGKRYRLANRYADELWGRIQQFRKDRLAIKLASRGLSKQSFYWLGQQLGSIGATPAYVTNANYRGRQYQEDAANKEEGTGMDYALTILNTSPIVQSAGGRAALLAAMEGETKYFERNMETRAFATIESRAAKYPGIFVKPSA